MNSQQYTPAERELLMQEVQMHMSQKRFQHVLGVEKRLSHWLKNSVLHRKSQYRCADS